MYQITHTSRVLGQPRRLLVVSMGNVSNNDLLAVFEAHLDTTVEAFGDADRVEVRPTRIVAWPRKTQ